MVQTAGSNQKIGLLGGTFDPVHNGHLAVANHVLEHLGLNSILFIPAFLPPHKNGHADGHEITGFDHRLAMLQMATADNAHFNVSGIEAQRQEPSFTIDTLNILVQQLSEPTEMYFIIGVDAFLEIHTWKQYENLPGLIHFVIISRPAYSPDMVGQVISKYFGEYVYDQDFEIWRPQQAGGNFFLLHMDPVHLSSTHIRENIRTNKSISGMVPATVEDYIKQQGLYGQ